jgi:flagellar basal-body rod modification protein FlgD
MDTSVAALTGGATTTTGTTTKSNTTVDKQEFMNMLVTQLKYQNPLSPMDGTDFTAQLAQFSSLEQMTGINNGVTSLNNIMGAGLIGKEVNMKDTTTSTISGITFDKGTTYLKLANGTNALMSNVTDIYEPKGK